MTQLVYTFIFVLLVQVTICAVASEDLDCGKKNAIKKHCATNCATDWCPDAANYSRVCDKQSCVEGCQCRFNEKFARNGTCIPTQQCPPFHCNWNEVYVACPPYCSDSCSQGNCQNFGVILMVVECIPQCRCKRRLNRKGGVCIPSKEC